MNNYTVVEERNNERVCWAVDTDADSPYDDGSLPVIHADYMPPGRIMAEQVSDLTSFELPRDIIDACKHYHSSPSRRALGLDATDAFERYLRIYHGTTTFARRDTRGGYYLAFDTAEWRFEMGLEDGDQIQSDPFGDFGHYLDGEVYVVFKQQKCDMGEWHTIASVSGVYGTEADLREAAMEFGMQPANDKVCPECETTTCARRPGHPYCYG